jgi:hypothetical protein
MLSLTNEADELHAFRVDITTAFVDIGGTDYWTFREITPLSAGKLLPQTKVSATYGYYVFGIALNFPVYTSHSVAMKLYRPGYELVEIDSWEFPGEIVWRKAPDLAGQEQALNRLFLLADNDGETTWPRVVRKLVPGSVSPEHRRALLFGASEYERLASGAAPGTEEAVRRRLQSKAKKLHQLAGKAGLP